MLGSQGVVLATAMLVSSTVLFLAFSKEKTTLFFPHQLSKNLDSHQSTTHNLRSCLSSSEEKKKKKKKKNKRVKFAENVKDTRGNGEEYRRREKVKSLFSEQETERENSSSNFDRVCRNEIPGSSHRMPANRIALYSGILRDRVHRIECSY